MPTAAEVKQERASTFGMTEDSGKEDINGAELSDEERQQLKLQLKIEEEAQIQQKLIDEFDAAVDRLPIPLELLKQGLSELGNSPQSCGFVYQKLSLPMCRIAAIDSFKEYPYIMNLELQGNAISGNLTLLTTDISVMGNMRYLVQVDLSNNKLSDNIRIDPPPFNLQLLDLSRNQLSNINDLAVHQHLSKLNLDRNLLII